MNREKTHLTKAELKLMNYLWNAGPSFSNEIMEGLPGPRPANNTISTLLGMMVKKELIGYKSYGRSHQYYPLIDRNEVVDKVMTDVRQTYFNGSYAALVAFFAKKEKIPAEEIAEIRELLDENEAL